MYFWSNFQSLVPCQKIVVSFVEELYRKQWRKFFVLNSLTVRGFALVEKIAVTAPLQYRQNHIRVSLKIVYRNEFKISDWVILGGDC